MGAAVWANPEGVDVAHGEAAFSQPDVNTLDIANTPGAILNWQQFSIQPGETTRFLQQSADSAVLNRVVGQDPSSLLGQLLSNGRVYLINRNGIVFGPDAVIDTAGLVASTLELSDADFLADRHEFKEGGEGGIRNQGYIKAGADGDIFLIAPNIENSGIIETQGGQLILAAGERVTLASLDSEHIVYEIEAPDNAVLNLGELLTRGGAAAIFAGTIRHEGAINADSVRMDAQGRIELYASDKTEIGATATLSANGPQGGTIRITSRDGATQVAGAIEASGSEAAGGQVIVEGEEVRLMSGAVIDVSGALGGGLALVGGDYQGANSEIQNARDTTVESGATIHADATDNGDGGKVIVWSDENTAFAGAISARGAGADGDGGFAEISGRERLNYRGRLDLGAALGDPGRVLFDPKYISIYDLGGVGFSSDLPVSGNDDFSENSGSSVTFDADDITAITDTGVAVDLHANTDISIDETLASNNPSGAGGNLGIHAGRSVHINADIDTDDGELVIVANDLGASTGDRDAGLAGIFMADGTTLDTGANNLTLEIDSLGQSGNMMLENLVATEILLRVNGQGDGLTGSSIRRTSADALITGNSLFVDHDPVAGPGGGSIGTASEPLRVQVNALAAHTHQASPGIFIDSPDPGQDLQLGDTFFGLSHSIKGVETLVNGDVVIKSAGSLSVVNDIRLADHGNLTLVADSNLDTVGNFEVEVPLISPMLTIQVGTTPANTGSMQIEGENIFLLGSVSSSDLEIIVFGGGAQTLTANNIFAILPDSGGLGIGNIFKILSGNGSSGPDSGGPQTLTAANGSLVIGGGGATASRIDVQIAAFNATQTLNIGANLVLDAGDPDFGVISIQSFGTISSGNQQEIFLNQDNSPGEGSLLLHAGSGPNNFVSVSASGDQLVDIQSPDGTGAGLTLLSAATTAGTGYAQLQASGDQIIISDGQIYMAPNAIPLRITAGGDQSITLSNGGLTIDSSASLTPVQGLVSGVTQTIVADSISLLAGGVAGSDAVLMSLSGLQDLTANGTGTAFLLQGNTTDGGKAMVQSMGNQVIDVPFGIIKLENHSGNASETRIQSGGAQTITAEDLYLLGGDSAAGNLAQILALGGLQTITIDNVLLLDGGALGDLNDAAITSIGGSSSITAYAIEVAGGDGGRAFINSVGASQIVNAVNSLMVSGGNGGDGHHGEITTDSDQTIMAGAGGITLYGGTGLSIGNHARIAQTGIGADQVISAPGGIIELYSVADHGMAEIVSTGDSQSITAFALTLESSASGAATDSAARIEGNDQHIAVSHGLTVQNLNPGTTGAVTGIVGHGAVQDIDADYILIDNASGTGASIEQLGPGQQDIATAGSFDLGIGLSIDDNGAGVDSFAGILCLGAGMGGACTGQKVNIGNTDLVRIGAANPVSLYGAGIYLAATGGSAIQEMRLSGSGMNILQIGDSSNGGIATISADGGSQIVIVGNSGEAGSLYILGGSADASSSTLAAGFESGNTTQSVAVRDGIFVIGGAAPAGDQNTGIVAFGNQTVAAGATGITLTGGGNTISGPGNSAIIGQFGAGFNQDIDVNGGMLTLMGGDGVNNNKALIKSLGAQDIAATDVSMFGMGVGSLNNALIESAAAQKISVLDALLLLGVVSGVNNDLIIHAVGGLQDIDAGGGIQLMGGSGGSDNGVIIRGDLGAQVNADYISIDGGMGVGNDARIDTRNALQKLTAADGILLQGGSGGSGSLAGIFADAGSEIAAGASGIELIGGVSAGTPGNPAVIEQQGASGNLTITLNAGGDLNLTGGGAGDLNVAAIRNLGGDLIIQTGSGAGVDLYLKGGAGAGSTNSIAALAAMNPAGNDVVIDIDGNLYLEGSPDAATTGNAARILSNAGGILGVFGGTGELLGGAGPSADATLKAFTLIDLEFGLGLELTGGTGADAYAAIVASDGDVTIDAGTITTPADMVLTVGAGANADAVILADAGTGTATILAGVCTGCDVLTADPLIDASAQTGIFGNLLLDATPESPEIVPGNEQVIVTNDLQDLFAGEDEELLAELGILESDEDEDDEDEEGTLLQCR
jgi:filamentous hemagglutinin family protein